MTSIAAMVMTPPLLRPANSSAGVAMPRSPETTSAQMSARTAGDRPVVITANVTTTMTAAIAAMRKTYRQTRNCVAGGQDKRFELFLRCDVECRPRKKDPHDRPLDRCTDGRPGVGDSRR